MGVNISYMGTKKELAPAVCDVIGHAQRGILLDAFSGMCSVGEQVGTDRQVWTNDIQVFAAETAHALFASQDEPMGAVRTADIHFDVFDNHRLSLSRRCSESIAAEDSLFDASDYDSFVKRKKKLSTKLRSEIPTMRRRQMNLFTKTYSDTYFGIRQAVEADAIVKTVISAHASGRYSDDHKRWLLIALGRALLKVANSTGHFAQFLKPHQSTYKRFVSQRRRSLWSEWLFSMGELHAVGTTDWRKKNKSFNQDSLLLLPQLAKQKIRPSVIYADPPYTDDQYSRYYHLLETLILYDYPTTSGAGLYRPDRFCTPFSLKSKAATAFESLISAAAKTGADLVLSYPNNGLVHEAGVNPKVLLKKYYHRVECSRCLSHSHSTFGASKGPASSEVTEFIYLAQA